MYVQSQPANVQIRGTFMIFLVASHLSDISTVVNDFVLVKEFGGNILLQLHQLRQFSGRPAACSGGITLLSAYFGAKLKRRKLTPLLPHPKSGNRPVCYEENCW